MDPQLRRVLQGVNNSGFPVLDVPGDADGHVNALLPDIVAQTDPGTSEDSKEETERKFPARGEISDDVPWGPGLEGYDQGDKGHKSSSSGHRKKGHVAFKGETDSDDPSLHVHGGDGGHDGHHQGQPSALALMQALPESKAPSAPLMRQPHVEGQLYPLVGNQVFSSDALMHFSQVVPSIGLTENLQVDFISPNSQANKSKKKTAASLCVEYHGFGKSPSSLASNYRLSWVLYDRRNPAGKVAYRQSEPMLLSMLKVHCAVAMGKDLGDWQINFSRNGTQVSSTTVTVVDPPAFPTGWSRRLNGDYTSIASPLIGYTTDEGLAFNPESYPIPDFPAGKSEQTFKVCWKFRGPQGCWNRIHGAYASAEEVYKTDGNVWNITTRVFTPGYESGRVSTQSGQGTLSALPPPAMMVGFPVAGDWKFEEKIDKAATTTTTLSIRQITSNVSSILHYYNSSCSR